MNFRFLLFLLKHFFPLAGRVFSLIRNRKVRAEIASIQFNPHSSSKLRLEIRSEGVLYIKVASSYIPVLKDPSRIIVSVPLKPGKSVIGLRAKGIRGSFKHTIAAENNEPGVQPPLYTAEASTEMQLKQNVTLKLVTPGLKQRSRTPVFRSGNPLVKTPGLRTDVHSVHPKLITDIEHQLAKNEKYGQ